jgi:hypothetical protein
MSELCWNLLLRSLLWLPLHVAVVHGSELQIPANTAYLEPDTGGATVSADKGVTQWKDAGTSVLWYGQIKQPGKLTAAVDIILPEGSQATFTLMVAPAAARPYQPDKNLDTTRTATAKGQAVGMVRLDFGDFDVTEPGYQVFRLSRSEEDAGPVGDVKALVLDGPSTDDAHFNLKPRRNAASVHLSYPVDRETKVSAFYCEMTGVEDPLWTYYMACGWHRGYFGMQVNSPTERRIIFSVWDSGGEAVDRKKVDDVNRVQLVAKGDGVYSGDFGNEGTGGHSHLKYWWKTGEKQKFLVTAEPISETHTVYAGYYFHPDSKSWMLISSWKAPKEGGYMRGLYSFSENFIGRNGNVLRKALYGNQWIRTAAGDWLEVTTAKFSHDGTGKTDRLDRFMGVEQGQFFLSHGGFVNGFTEFGVPFERVSSGPSPADIQLPSLPAAR